MIELWHVVPRNPSPDGYSMPFSPRVNAKWAKNVVWDDDPEWVYKRIAPVPTEDLDRAWELTNTIDKPWWTNAGVESDAGKPGHPGGYRSTIVGDMFVIKETGARHVVASFGFETI